MLLMNRPEQADSLVASSPQNSSKCLVLSSDVVVTKRLFNFFSRERKALVLETFGFFSGVF